MGLEFLRKRDEKVKNMTFFVMVYSYRDLELGKTIKDLYEKADNPKDIFVGVINADDVPYKNRRKNVRIKNVDYTKYHGPCKGCYEILTELYQGEDYIVKIDPHERFEKGWDTYYKQFIGPDRVVCSRCLGYHLDGTFDKLNTAYSKPKGWHNHQIIELEGTDYEGVEKEVFFFNAGFFIAPKSWAEKVGYDPHLAMWGEETDLSCRTFLAGYKIINVPARVYHLYGRKNRKSLDISSVYQEMDLLGIERVKLKLGLVEPRPELMEEWDKYGVDGREYKKKIDSIINAEHPNRVMLDPKTVVVCPHCNTKTFFNLGTCKWCYKNLDNAKVVK